MCFYIGIEDLAANAMIEMLKKGGQRFLTYNEIEMYGAEVVQILKENGQRVEQRMEKKLFSYCQERIRMLFSEITQNFLKKVSRTEKEVLS